MNIIQREFDTLKSTTEGVIVTTNTEMSTIGEDMEFTKTAT
jgi:hypothetical protein